MLANRGAKGSPDMSALVENAEPFPPSTTKLFVLVSPLTDALGLTLAAARSPVIYAL